MHWTVLVTWMSTRAVHIELIELISSAVIKTLSSNDQHICKVEVKIIKERTFRLFFLFNCRTELSVFLS